MDTSIKFFACGADVMQLKAFRSALDIGSKRYLERVFTLQERTYCAGDLSRLAARLAVKEAVAKALGTGLRGVGWQEIEIVSEASGRPQLVLHGRALRKAQTLGLLEWRVSLSCCELFALAFVVATGPGSGKGTATEEVNFQDMALIFEGCITQRGDLASEV